MLTKRILRSLHNNKLINLHGLRYHFGEISKKDMENYSKFLHSQYGAASRYINIPQHIDSLRNYIEEISSLPEPSEEITSEMYKEVSNINKEVNTTLIKEGKAEIFYHEYMNENSKEHSVFYNPVQVKENN